MAITIPPYQQTSPGDDAALLERGVALGQQHRQLNQSRERLKQTQEQLDLMKTRAAVQDKILQQRQQLLIQQAAAASKAQMDYQRAIQGGMDPVQAAMMYGLAMSGGKMTGYAPVFSDYEKAHAPAFDAKPVTDASGKTIGYEDRNGAVRYIPQAKAPLPQYETITDTTPGTTTVPGVPGSAAVPPHDFFGFKWGGSPAVPAIPAIPGRPTERTSRRVPIPYGPPIDQTITNAPAANVPVTAQANPDDPLGILTR